MYNFCNWKRWHFITMSDFVASFGTPHLRSHSTRNNPLSKQKSLNLWKTFLTCHHNSVDTFKLLFLACLNLWSIFANITWDSIENSSIIRNSIFLKSFCKFAKFKFSSGKNGSYSLLVHGMLKRLWTVSPKIWIVMVTFLYLKFLFF